MTARLDGKDNPAVIGDRSIWQVRIVGQLNRMHEISASEVASVRSDGALAVSRLLMPVTLSPILNAPEFPWLPLMVVSSPSLASPALRGAQLASGGAGFEAALTSTGKTFARAEKLRDFVRSSATPCSTHSRSDCHRVPPSTENDPS